MLGGLRRSLASLDPFEIPVALRLELAHAARRAGAGFGHVVAGTPIRQVARQLAAAGVLEAA